MDRIMILAAAAALVCGCQSTKDPLTTASTPIAITEPVASAIAGDMASRLAEHLGPAGPMPIEMRNDKTDFAVALEAAMRGWGYRVIPDTKPEKGQIELSYSLDSFDGQFLAHVATPAVALARTYSGSAIGAVPSSPLSIMQR